LGKIAVVKGIERAENQSIQPSEVRVKRELEDVKRNLFFVLHRLWFLMSRNRLLFWGGVVTFSVMLGASVALLTPIWSDRSTSQAQKLTSGNSKLHDSDLSRNGLQYQVARSVNILVMGVEPNPNVRNTSPEAFSGSSETMLLLRLEPNDKAMRVLSIPKDSQVTIPEIGLEKISIANSLGGPAFAARVVSRTLNNVPIDRYVRITTDALRELVDQLGGVEVFVPQRMAYKDATQQFEIDLEPGWQTLNGEQAVQFARFRDSETGDLERVQRQQALLKALRDRLTSPAVLPRLSQITRIVQSYVDTNLSPEEILALVTFSVEVEQQNFQMVLLPGDLSPLSRDPNSYWIYAAGQDQVMSKYFGVNLTGVTQKPRSLTTQKIALQNASGQPNLSQRVANYLKQQGFDQVYIVSDLPASQRQTEIIAQKGNLEAAAELQKVLGLGNIEASATGDLKSYLTIRVGKDWDSSQPPLAGNKNNGWRWGFGSRDQDRGGFRR